MPKNNEWKISSAKFQGYVKKSLETIEEKLGNHENKFDDLFKELEEQKLFHERIKIKLGIIAAGAGAIFAVAWHFIRKMFS